MELFHFLDFKWILNTILIDCIKIGELTIEVKGSEANKLYGKM